MTSNLVFEEFRLPAMRGAFSLRVESGSRVAVVGPIGSGKSALLGAAVGTFKGFDGNVHFNGVDLRACDAVRCADLRIAYVPQAGGAFGDLSALENLRLAWECVPVRTARWRDSLANAVRAMPPVERFLTRYARNLSGGQLKMLSIMRAWITAPLLLVLDEPFNGLDTDARRLVLRLLDDFSTRGGVAVAAYQFAAEDRTAAWTISVAPDTAPKVTEGAPS